MGTRIRPALPPAPSLDIALLARALTNTYIHTHIFLGDTLRTSGSASQNFLSFHVTCWPPQLQASESRRAIVAALQLVVHWLQTTYRFHAVCIVVIIQVFLCLLPFSYLADLHLSALVIISSLFLLSLLLIEISFLSVWSCRPLVMQILTCSFALLAINWNQQIDWPNSCSLATWCISRATIRTCQQTPINIV